MKGYRKSIGAVLALGVLAALSVVFFQSRGPDYQGKSLSAWLQDWDDSFGSPGKAFPTDRVAQVENAIQHMGAKAVPSLRRMLRARDTQLRKVVVAYCSKQSWIPIHFRPPAYRLNVRGLFGIRTLGPVAKPAMPELVGLLGSQDWTIRAAAAGALGKIGRAANTAIPDLVTRLGDKDEHVREAACHALAEIGAGQEIVLPALLPCLRSDKDVREAATGALMKIDPDTAAQTGVTAPPAQPAEASPGSGTLALQGPASMASNLLEHTDEKHVAVKMRDQK